MEYTAGRGAIRSNQYNHKLKTRNKSSIIRKWNLFHDKENLLSLKRMVYGLLNTTFNFIYFTSPINRKQKHQGSRKPISYIQHTVHFLLKPDCNLVHNLSSRASTQFLSFNYERWGSEKRKPQVLFSFPFYSESGSHRNEIYLYNFV